MLISRRATRVLFIVHRQDGQNGDDFRVSKVEFQGWNEYGCMTMGAYYDILLGKETPAMPPPEEFGHWLLQPGKLPAHGTNVTDLEHVDFAMYGHRDSAFAEANPSLAEFPWIAPHLEDASYGATLITESTMQCSIYDSDDYESDRTSRYWVPTRIEDPPEIVHTGPSPSGFVDWYWQ